MQIKTYKYWYWKNKFTELHIEEWGTKIESSYDDWKELIECADDIIRFKDNEKEYCKYLMEKVKENMTTSEFEEFISNYH